MMHNCEQCKRTGLAIFPAVYAAAPKEAASSCATPSGNLGSGVVDKQLKESRHYVRGLPAGYLYLLCGNAWRGYMIDVAGYPRYYPNLVLQDMPSSVPTGSDVVQCARQGKSHTGIEAITIERPDLIKGPVYIAFSRFKWTKATRERIAQSPEPRMQRVFALDGSAFPHAEVASADKLQRLIADFSVASVRALNRTLPVDEQIVDRSNQADDISKAMLAASGSLNKPGLIMALHDPVGITWSLNRHGKWLQAKAAEVSGIGEEERARKRVVAEIIEGIRLNAEANPGPWYDKNYGPERFLKHIQQGPWQAALVESKDFKALEQRMNTASADYVLWKESSAWKLVQAVDFDAANDASARDHERMVAFSVAGTGLTKVEREKVWQAVLHLPATSPDNWLYRAISALNADFIVYLSADKKEDKEYDAFKNVAALTKTTAEEGTATLAKFHAVLYAKRQASESTQALIESTAAMLFRMRQDNPQAFNKFMRAVTRVLICRADVTPQPVAVRGTASRVAAFIHQIANVRELPGGQAPVVHKSRSGNAGTRKGNFGSKAWELADAAGAEVVFKAPSTQEETRTTVAWVLHRLRSGASLNEKLLQSLSLKHVDLTVPQPKENPFLEAHVARLGAKADGVLSAGGVLFQVYSFSNALQTYSKEGTGNKVDGGVGMTTAVISASAGLMEIRAATLVVTGNKGGAAIWLRWAGRFSLAAGIIEGAYLVVKGGIKRATTADHDSAYWTMGTGLFVALGGVAGFGAAAAGASAVATGGVVGTATALGLTLGPIGWTLLALALLGAALYCSWQAWATDDANLLPVEYWLDNGSFGKRQFVAGEAAAGSPYLQGDKAPPFGKLDHEIEALQRVLFVAQGRIWVARDTQGISIVCNYDVAVPRYESGSRLEIAFSAIDKGRKLEIGRIVCENGQAKPSLAHIESRMTGLRQGPNLQVDPKTGTLRVTGLFSTLQDPTLVHKAFDYFGWKKDTNVYADSFQMQVMYWPDRVNLSSMTSEVKVAS